MMHYVVRTGRMLSFKAKKQWYRFVGHRRVAPVDTYVRTHKKRFSYGVGIVLSFAALLTSIVLPAMQVHAQTMNLGANDFMNGTMQYGTTQLNNQNTQLSLQQGVVGSWDAATIDGMQANQVLTRGVTSLAYGPNNLIYYLANAEGQCYFRSYDTEQQQWNILKSVPVGCGAGSKITTDGVRYVYYFPGGSLGAFYRYDIATASWKQLTDVPSQVSDISDGVYTTQNNTGYIYFFRGGASASMLRYNVSADQWSTMAAFPTNSNVTNGIAVTWDKADTLYAINNQVGEFKKYTISTNTWTTIGSVSLPNTRVGLAYTSGVVIMTKLRVDGGYERGSMASYNTTTNAWTDLPQPPVGATEYDWPPVSTYDGSRFLYASYGTEIFRDMYRYDTVSQTWNTASLFNTGSDTTDWHQNLIYDGSQAVYFAGGTGSTSVDRIYKYDLASKQVTQIGSQIATQSGWKGVYKSGALYMLPTSGQTVFQKYDTATNAWTQLAALPVATNWGLDIIDGNDGFLYASFGGGTAFYRYNISNNTWAALTAMPQSIGVGGGLTRVGTTIYAQMGNGTGFFYKYNMSTNAWTQITSYEPNGKIDHGGFITGDGSRYLYLGTGTRSNGQNKRLFRYDTTNDSWQRLADVPADTNLGASSFYDSTNSKLYVAQNWFSSRLWTWSPSSANYVQNGTWYSKTFSLTQVQSWQSLQATVGGTGTATIYTRTSDNGNLWSDWQATNGTTINSPPNKYLQLKINLSGNGSATPTVSNVSVQYNQETTPPSLPSQFTAYDKAGGTAQLSSGQTYQYQHPYFAWSGADDGASGSGVDGYYVYFGTDSGADPVTDGNYQSSSSYTTTAPMTAGNLYYLRIKVKDKLGNTSGVATYFSYRYWYISPPGSQVMTSDQDFSAGTNTRVNIVNGAMQLRQLSTGSWGVGATDMLPDTTYGSSEVVIGDSLYIMRGASSATMWQYDLSNKTWQTMASAPGVFSTGSSLTYDGSRYIYAIAGNGTNNFYRYDTVNNAWSTLPSLPSSAQIGSDIKYLGAGKIALFFTGAREFDIYDIASATFTTKTSYPASTSYGGSGIWYDGSDTIYAYLGQDSSWNFSNNNRTVLAKYSLTNDSWKTLATPPVSAAYVQNNLVSDGHGNLYFFTSDIVSRLGYGQMVYKYNIAKDNWDEVSGLSSQVYYGSVTSDNNRYIYILPSENNLTRKMLRYDTRNNQFTPTTKGVDKWERPSWDYPVNSWQWQQGNASSAAYDGSKYVYVLGGNEGTFSRFVRFDPQTGETVYLPPPYYVNMGGSLAYLNGQLYYLRGGGTKDFYRYNPTNQTWGRVADIPGTSYRPGPSTLQVVGSSIYALSGNNNGLYAYTPDSGAGTWTQKANAPGTVLNGSAVYDSANGYIYVAAGNNTAGFYRYSVTANTWSSLASLPGTTSHGSALALQNGKIYAAAGNYSNTMYVYDVAAGTWSAGTTAPEQFRYGAMFIPVNNSYFLAMPGASSPDFWRFNYPSSTTAYEGMATHISQPLVIAGIYDYANITAQVDIPSQTSIEFATRSSDDGVNWNDWTLTSDVKYYSGQLTARVLSTPKKYTQIKVSLASADNLYSPTVSSYALNYYYDVDPPSNPSVMNVYQSDGSSTALTSNTWYNYSQPSFDWPDPGQAGGATDGPLGSNIAGYWVYLGNDPTASPRTAGQFVTDSNYIPNLQTSGTYYLRIQAQDMTGNVDPTIYAPFVYKFDKDPPSIPNLITVTPGGYTTTNNYTFDWPAALDPHSGIAGYCYHTGATSGAFAAETCQSGRNLSNISAAYRTGTNVLYLRTVDNAGNYSTGYTTVSYYYSTDPPSPPTNLRAIPPTSPQNLFAFAWDLPSLYSGDPNQLTYCYSINELPSALNTTCGRDRFISAFKAATRQGTNIIYMVSKDEAGNVNWNDYTSANFIANTVSPGIPLNPVVTDTSDRVTQRWSMTLTWDKPTFTGNGIANYIVERSPDGHSFTEIGKTSTTAFVDLDVQPALTYYYRVRAADNVDNRGGPSGTVSGAPRGSFTTPPSVVSQPSVEAGFDQATIHWVTNRPATGFIYYGTNPSDLSQSKGTLDLATDHSITISGLSPSATYYYRVQSFDNERTYSLNDAYSQIFYFKTTESARIYGVATDGTTLSSTILSWQTSVPTKARVEYGTSQAYGMTADDDAGYGTNHTFKLTGLTGGTTYHFRIVGTTEFGSVVRSDDYTVTTISRPVVSNIRFNPVEDTPTTGVQVSWDTNVPTSSTVQYQGGGTNQEVSKSELVTEHVVELDNLASSTEYALTLQGRDQYGNLATSDVQRWQSGFDTRPPSVSGTSLSVTTTEGSGNTRAQLIVSWKTDEPATSQVTYQKSAKGSSEKSTPLDTEPTTNHVVVISNLDLASIYSVQIATKDISGNTAYVPKTLVVTPDKETSVLDSVITLMQRLFRF